MHGSEICNAWASAPTFTVCNSLAKALVSFSDRGAGGAIALPPALAKNPMAFLQTWFGPELTAANRIARSVTLMMAKVTPAVQSIVCQPVLLLLFLPGGREEASARMAYKRPALGL